MSRGINVVASSFSFSSSRQGATTQSVSTQSSTAQSTATQGTTAQDATARVQADTSKAMDVMKDMVTGKVSKSDGIKQLQSLVVDQAVAVGALPASAANQAGGAASGTGFSTKDTFDAGGARSPLDLSGGAAKPTDSSYLDKESGGGSKPGVVSGSN